MSQHIHDTVRGYFDEICARYALGQSMASIAAHVKVSPLQIRCAIRSDRDMAARWDAIQEYRATGFVERAAEMAEECATAGDFKASADVYVKLAEKVAPRQYGAKASMEITGKDGGAIQSIVTMTPADAYLAMIGGK
jgi:hypothetical protein